MIHRKADTPLSNMENRFPQCCRKPVQNFPPSTWKSAAVNDTKMSLPENWGVFHTITESLALHKINLMEKLHGPVIYRRGFNECYMLVKG